MSQGGSVELDDVQGLVRFGYKHLTEACFLLLRVKDPAAARAWLAQAPITSAVKADRLPQTALQIALTSEGLRALEVAADLCAEFSAEFVAGMASDAARGAVWEMSAPMIQAVGNGASASGCRTSPCSSMPGPGGWRVGAGDRSAMRSRLRAHRAPVDIRYAGRGAVRICRRHFATGSRLGARAPGGRPRPARLRQPRLSRRVPARLSQRIRALHAASAAGSAA